MCSYLTIIRVKMNPANPFDLIYPPLLKHHLRAIAHNHHSLIRQSIEYQLRLEPDIETTNRKPLKRPALIGAKWELRCGPHNRFRVFYRIDYVRHAVILLAIGEKIGNRLFIGGEEVEL